MARMSHRPNPPRARHLLLSLALALGLGLAGLAQAADRSHQREQFRQALDAARQGRPWKASAADLGDYPLLPWLEQAALLRRLDQLDTAAVQSFLERWPESLAASDLRGAFLRELARRQQWRDFLALYRAERDGGSRELACHALRARLAQAQTLTWETDLAPLWRSANALPEACDPVLAWARQQGLLDPARLWARLDLARDAGNAALVEQLGAGLPAPDRPAAQRTAAALRDPAAALKAATDWPDDAHHRDAVLGGLLRLARRRAAEAEALWPALRGHFHFSETDQARVAAALALYHATDFDADAVARLAALPAEVQDDATREWRVRAALATGDWAATLAALDALSDTQKADNEWRYLRARVLGKLGRGAEAQALFAALAGEATYFGFLAADWLDRPYEICPLRVARDAAAEQALLVATPELARAFEWEALARLPEARRAWDFAVAGLDPERRRLAADLAYRSGWYDRAVFALNKGEELRLYEQRFPLAREKQIRRDSAAAGIDPAWAYAIIRAESAWVADARSGANAYGLMQLLPGTAAQLAKSEKIPYRRAEDLFHPDTNIALGTRYLGRMAQRYAGATWLASAAYNAGAAPVERWLAARGALEPDFFVATIPYRETREYVARVLAVSVIYDWRMNREVLALGARMPRAGQAAAEALPRKAVACSADAGAAAAATAAAAPR